MTADWDPDYLEQLLAGGDTGNGHHDPTEDDDLQRMLIRWGEFWELDLDDADWIAEPIIASKRSTAIFAPGGTGKSLLALWIAVHLATGIDPLTRHPITPVNVLYLDYEMTLNDLAERLEHMGYGPSSNLEHLHYALLPALPGLDHPEGGRAICRLAELCDATLVVIDTFGRAIHGDENDADTIRAWYRWTGLHLKNAGRAFLRVDHAGKDLSKGQRGSSAKNDDVDVVWQMAPKESGRFTLTAKKRRMGWVPERVDIELDQDDRLTWNLIEPEDVWPSGTFELVKILDRLDVGTDLSARKATRLVREAGHTCKDVTMRAAVKYRTQRSLTFHFHGDDAVKKVADDDF